MARHFTSGWLLATHNYPRLFPLKPPHNCSPFLPYSKNIGKLHSKGRLPNRLSVFALSIAYGLCTHFFLGSKPVAPIFCGISCQAPPLSNWPGLGRVSLCLIWFFTLKLIASPSILAVHNELFQLTTVTRVLDEGVELTEALGFPEISALAAAERHWRKLIQSKAKSLLEDNNACPAGALYRRRLSAKVELDDVEVTLNPPPRSAKWQEPITIRLPFVRWAEELHHAYVPAMGILVFAPREALLVERLRQHARLLLFGKGRRLRLDRLARVARNHTLQLGQVDITANIKTPKQKSAVA